LRDRIYGEYERRGSEAVRVLFQMPIVGSEISN
jgi:hypothetical protein